MFTHPGKFCQPCTQTSWHALMRSYPAPRRSRGLQCTHHIPALGQSQHCTAGILKIPGSCIPVGYSCLHIFPSPVCLCSLIVTHLTWVQAGQAPFPSRMLVGRWCTSQTQTCLCICVSAQGACSTLHLLQAADKEGQGHRHDMVASISPVHSQKPSARPNYQRENLPLVVCALVGLHGISFSSLSHLLPWWAPTSLHALTPPEHSSDGLQCPFPSQGHRSFLLPLSPNYTGCSRVHPCQSQPPQWQDKQK